MVQAGLFLILLYGLRSFVDCSPHMGMHMDCTHLNFFLSFRFEHFSFSMFLSPFFLTAHLMPLSLHLFFF